MSNNIYNKLRRITSNQLYFPEIDGIRFLAITLVILFHIHGYFLNKSPVKDSLSPNNALDTFLSNSGRGVELFFVLSGFILCLPFAHHYINKGKKVLLKKYYLRRVTRLEPPYLIAITGIFLLQIFMRVHTAAYLTPHWLASLGYLHDLIYHREPVVTVVAWSLEVEIQFYILAPLFFTILSLNKVARRSLLLACIIGIVLLQSVFPPTFSSIYRFAQYFFTGMLLADFYVSNTAAGLFNKKWMALAALPCFIIMVYLPLKDETLMENDLLVVRLFFPFITGLFYYIIFKNNILKSIFSYKFIPIIGGMCYSIYLLHYTIISFLGRFTIGLQITGYYLPNLLLQTILLCIPILLLSSVYYYYIERPFMSGKWVDMLIRKDKKAEEINAVS